MVAEKASGVNDMTQSARYAVLFCLTLQVRPDIPALMTFPLTVISLSPRLPCSGLWDPKSTSEHPSGVSSSSIHKWMIRQVDKTSS